MTSRASSLPPRNLLALAALALLVVGLLAYVAVNA